MTRSPRVRRELKYNILINGRAEFHGVRARELAYNRRSKLKSNCVSRRPVSRLNKQLSSNNYSEAARGIENVGIACVRNTAE